MVKIELLFLDSGTETLLKFDKFLQSYDIFKIDF
jgi:hypothetical protein